MHDENQFSKGYSPRQFVYPEVKGKFIALCEGDDYWLSPLKLQKQILSFEPCTSLVFHDVLRVENNKVASTSYYDKGKPLPIYGQGHQIRDWLYVEDHAKALYKVVTEGKVGETYNIGGHNEKQNIEVVKIICQILDDLKPQDNNQSYESLITFVQDRPGHDMRYAIDASKIKNELGWTPTETFDSGIRRTVEWYLNNLEWCRRVQDGSYQRERLGVQL